MFENPIISKYSYHFFRPVRILSYTAIFVIVIGGIILVNYLNYYHGEATVEKAMLGSYGGFLFIGLVLSWFLGTHATTSSVNTEISEGTVDFFRLLPIPAYKKTLGVWAGSNLIVLIFSPVVCLLLLLAGYFGKLSWNLQAQVIGVWISVYILMNTVGVLFSFKSAKKKIGKNLGIFLAVILILPYMIGGLFELLYRPEQVESTMVWFYGLEMPLLTAVAAVALFLAGWAYAGTIRKFSHEWKTMFSVGAALIFLACIEVITAGFLYHYFNNAGFKILWAITLLSTLAIFAGVLKRRDMYFEMSRQMAKEGRIGLSQFIYKSNISVAFGLAIIWFLGGIWPAFWLRLTLGNNLLLMAGFGSFYLFYFLLFEAGNIYSQTSKFGFVLAGTVIGIQMFFPLFASFMTDLESLILFSPLGILIPDGYEKNLLYGVLGMNLVLSILPAYLILKEYGRIVRARARV